MTDASTDPRVGALLELTQGLLTRYTELASSVAGQLPGPVRAELVDHVQTVAQEARDRYAEIAAMPYQSAADRIEDYARQPGIDDAQRRILRGAVRVARGEQL
ncbi:hypothetical protein G3I39_25025 [Streptomyces fulvissimus]|uniref:Uncharacterized protein n=1 Tax=Streptomyces microflavus TaxID=1919 RepID=A0A6N9VFP5_STRMI|nr:hypothetical protein [Streptomyces microflavus]NEB70292.1 hypothetical protein [Streptomyces microflavus]NEE45571.1 hypothetical protein [Streptomyces sp. SID8455]